MIMLSLCERLARFNYLLEADWGSSGFSTVLSRVTETGEISLYLFLCM